MSTLLDGNVLVALAVEDHVHHAAAQRWLGSHDDRVASCPTTQGVLVRLVVRGGGTARLAQSLLSEAVAHPRHEFWPDDLSYLDVPLTGVIGHRQVTDAYLAALARHRDGRLATFDKGLAALHPDVAELVPIG